MEANMMKPIDTDVVIIGAGSTGLLLAQGLKAARIPFRIFERHGKDHVSREWSMSLHWGGEFLTNVLPPTLRDRLDEINTDPDHDFSSDSGFVQCNGATSEVILVMPGVMPRRVSRRKLRTLMSEGLDIEYNKSLTNLIREEGDDSSSPAVTASFSDDGILTCRIVIGCDGSRSRVRQILMADDALSAPTATPYTILNFPYTYPSNVAEQLRAIHPVFKVSYHPKLNCMYMLSVLDTTNSKATGDVTFQNLLSWTGEPTAPDIKADPVLALKHLRETGAQFAPPFSVAAANVADDAHLFVDQGMQWDPRLYFNVSAERATSWNGRSWAGTVTLAGDAAHAMLPHRGQGLNHALEDAARLVAALTTVFKDKCKSLPEAITEYEEEMVSRGGGEVETTAKAAWAAHDWNVLMQSPMFKHGANKVK